MTATNNCWTKTNYSRKGLSRGENRVVLKSAPYNGAEGRILSRTKNGWLRVEITRDVCKFVGSPTYKAVVKVRNNPFNLSKPFIRKVAARVALAGVWQLVEEPGQHSYYWQPETNEVRWELPVMMEAAREEAKAELAAAEARKKKTVDAACDAVAAAEAAARWVARARAEVELLAAAAAAAARE